MTDSLTWSLASLATLSLASLAGFLISAVFLSGAGRATNHATDSVFATESRTAHQLPPPCYPFAEGPEVASVAASN